MKITVVGTGYVGLVTGACFSEVGHDVLCVDNNEKKVAMLNRLEMPIYEDGLEPMVRKNVAEGRLRFTSSIKEGTDFAEVIFVAVGTPPGRSGEAKSTAGAQRRRRRSCRGPVYGVLRCSRKS